MVTYYISKILKKLRLSAVRNSKIHSSSKIESGSHLVNVLMNSNSFCGYNCELANCTIGSFCSIANNVIIGGAMHPIDWVSTSPAFYEGRDSIKKKYALHHRQLDKKTTIGHDVWIGHGAIIKQGVNIGTGAVIGMGSVVTKDIEPYSIVAGNPARVIRMRFSNEVIEGLLESKWWEFDDNKLMEYAPYFKNPVEFLKKIKE